MFPLTKPESPSGIAEYTSFDMPDQMSQEKALQISGSYSWISPSAIDSEHPNLR